MRKAIKLTLLVPEHAKYRDFTDELLAVYREACRVRNDQRFGDEGRKLKVVQLQDRIFDLCVGDWNRPKCEGPADDYRLLVNEIMKLCDEELFTFVTAPPVEQVDGSTKPVDGTNNEAERSLRDTAQARLTGRTNKTFAGARWKSVLTSVFESLKLYLADFTLQSVLDEMARWEKDGRSCFGKMLDKLKLTLPEKPLLDQLFPPPAPAAVPSG